MQPSGLTKKVITGTQETSVLLYKGEILFRHDI